MTLLYGDEYKVARCVRVHEAETNWIQMAEQNRDQGTEKNRESFAVVDNNDKYAVPFKERTRMMCNADT